MAGPYALCGRIQSSRHCNFTHLISKTCFYDHLYFSGVGERMFMPPTFLYNPSAIK